MTGRTHDLAAFTALSYVAVTQPISDISLATAAVAIGANFLGGLAPDLDQTTSEFWQHIRGGSFISKLIAPLLGGHRFISHSFVGIIIFGFVVDKFLMLLSNVLLVNMEIVWWAFMIGFVSHLVTDSLTRDGVPWFFPIPIKIGFPPLSILRFKTGGLIEKSFIFPVLVLINFYLLYAYYGVYISYLRMMVR